MNTREEIKNLASNMFNVRDDLKNTSPDDIKANRARFGFSVATFNVLGDLNLGNIMRTSLSFGADCMYIIGRRRYDRRSCVGSQNYMDVHYIEYDDIDYDDAFVKIINDGYYPVLVEQGFPVINEITWNDYPDRPCFVFGNEGFGIPEEVSSRCEFGVSVKMPGPNRSLNVSVAAGIVIHSYMCYSGT